MAGYHDAQFWLQIEPDFYGGEDPKIRAIKAVGLTQKRPRQPRNAVLVKLTVQVPDAAFLPLRPEAVIVIPEGMTAINEPIIVEAVEP